MRISLNHIKKIYGSEQSGTVALCDVNLEIEDQSLVAVMGSSGSGKSTLLNIIGCMDSMTEGQYIFEDGEQSVDVSKLKGKKLEEFRNKHIGFVFQQFALISDYTVYQNIELPLRARNVKEKERKKLIESYMEYLGIADLAQKLPSKISGGQQQRCAIARALVSGCDVILADEPTGALDSKTSKEIMELFVELKKKGKTIVVVTHDPIVASYADCLHIIEDGKIAINTIEK